MSFISNFKVMTGFKNLKFKNNWEAIKFLNPIFQFQTLHPRKVLLIIADKDGIEAQGLSPCVRIEVH